MAVEPAIYAEWSNALLSADPTLQSLPCPVYEGVAKPGASLPYIIRTPAGGPGYLYSEGLQIVWYEGVWYFTVFVAGNDLTRLSTILDRLHTCLQRASGTTADGRVLLNYQSTGAHSAPPDATGGQLVTSATVEYTALVQVN